MYSGIDYLATLHGVVFDILVGSQNRVGLPPGSVACRAVARVQRPALARRFPSVFAFAALQLRRTPRFALRSPRGCATRSPKGEAWWARQPPYEAAFLEGFLGFIKMLIQRVPTKMPTT
jgi:hypothetical protein